MLNVWIELILNTLTALHYNEEPVRPAYWWDQCRASGRGVRWTCCRWRRAWPRTWTWTATPARSWSPTAAAAVAGKTGWSTKSRSISKAAIRIQSKLAVGAPSFARMRLSWRQLFWLRTTGHWAQSSRQIGFVSCCLARMILSQKLNFH